MLGGGAEVVSPLRPAILEQDDILFLRALAFVREFHRDCAVASK
jgi:hypothetical protein